MSSNENVTKDLDKIVLYQLGETFHGTISETQYASGNSFFVFNYKCAIHEILYDKTDEGVNLMFYRDLCSSLN